MRFSVALTKDGAQAFVTTGNVSQGLFQRARLEFAVEAGGDRNVVGRARPL